MTHRDQPAAGQPHWGFTRHHRFAVHARTTDHLRPREGDSTYQRFNKRIALWQANNIGTMTAYWTTLFLCLCALPAVLDQMGVLSTRVFFARYGFYLLLTWGISTTFQAVMLPGLLVGQSLQNEAADARAAKQFEDSEQIRDWLDLKTQGGLTAVLKTVENQRDQLAMLAAAVQTLMSNRTDAAEKLAGAVQAATAKVDDVHRAVTAMTPSPAGSAGTGGPARAADRKDAP
jgi:hypothetical protein